MYDSRFIWIQHMLPDPSQITVIVPKNVEAAGLKTLKDVWIGQNHPTVIETKQFFSHSFQNSMGKSKNGIIIYFIHSRNFSKNLKGKLNNNEQNVLMEYTIFPNWKNPRWFIPKWRSLSPANMSRMIQPTTLVARIAVILFRILKGINCSQLIFPYRMVVAYKKQKPVQTFINFFQDNKETDIQSGILYTGSYGPLQKFTVELFKERKSLFGYAKFGHNKYTDKAIQNERFVIEKLSQLTIEKIKAARLINFNYPQEINTQFLTMKVLSGGSKLNKITKPIINGLAELYFLTEEKDSISLQTLIVSHANDLSEIDCSCLPENYQNIRDEVVSILTNWASHVSTSLKIPLSLSHGDFTRWNIRADSSRIYVIDWEEAAMRPAGHDLLSFLLAEFLLVGRTSPERSSNLLYQEISSGLYYDFLMAINWKNNICGKHLSLLFFASTLISMLWHAERHVKMNCPIKNNLYDIINVAYLSIKKIVGGSRFGQ